MPKLGDATAVYRGSSAASAVYLGATQVWSASTTYSGQAALAAGSALTAAGSRSALGAVTLAAAGAATAALSGAVAGAATLSGAATLTAAASRTAVSSAALAGAGAVTAAAVRTTTGAAALAGAGALSATATTSAPLGQVTGLRVDSTAPTSVALSWSTTSGASSYLVEYRVGTSGGFTTFTQPTPPSVQPVSYWKGLFDATRAAYKSTGLALGATNDSWRQYGMAYYLDGFVSMYEATGVTSYATDAFDLVDSMTNTAVLSSSIPSSQYKDGYYGWVSRDNVIAEHSAEYLKEVPLFESYCWRYVFRLLYVTRNETGTLATRRSTLQAWAEVNMWDKWSLRDGGGPDLYRSQTHMVSHWAYIGRIVNVISTNQARRTAADQAANAIDQLMPGYEPASLHNQLILQGDGGYFWDSTWGSTAHPGQDVSHGNAMVAYTGMSKQLGREWTQTDMTRFCKTLARVNGSGTTYPNWVDGTQLDYDGWWADGFGKLGRYDATTQATILDGHTEPAASNWGSGPVPNEQFYGAMAASASALTATTTTVTGLSASTSYQFRVTAVGSATPSSPVVAATGGGTAPTMTAAVEAHVAFSGSASGSVVTAAFTPAVGDLLVAKGTAGGPELAMGAISGGSLVWTQHLIVTAAGVSGMAIWTAKATAATSMTVTLPYVNSAAFALHGSLTVERYSGAQLATVPATASFMTDLTSPFATTITTMAPKSLVSWVATDWNVISGSTTYSSSATQTALYLNAGNLSARFAYQAAVTAGPQTFGMTAPAGQRVSLAAIEIQSAT